MYQRYHRAQRTRFARLQNRQNRGNRNENTQKQLAHFGNRVEIEFITRPNLLGRNQQRNNGQRQQNHIAHQVLQRIVAAQNFKSRMIGFPQARQQNRTNHARQQ